MGAECPVRCLRGFRKAGECVVPAGARPPPGRPRHTRRYRGLGARPAVRGQYLPRRQSRAPTRAPQPRPPVWPDASSQVTVSTPEVQPPQLILAQYARGHLRTAFWVVWFPPVFRRGGGAITSLHGNGQAPRRRAPGSGVAPLPRVSKGSVALVESPIGLSSIRDSWFLEPT
ncbi:uncharacterized protein LOC144337122 [Macaca mulatta]